jgi:hypothetical protein
MGFTTGRKTNLPGNQPGKNQFMKASITKLAETPQTPVFQTVIVKPRVNRKAAIPSPQSKKRDNTFSQSRDTREDRGSRQMKMSHNSQTFPHGKQ